MLGLDWNSWRCYTRTNRKGDLVVVQWARAMKP